MPQPTRPSFCFIILGIHSIYAKSESAGIFAERRHVAPEMMKTYSHIRRQALNQAADALEPNAPASPAPPPLKVAAAAVPTPAKRVMSHSTSQNTNRRGRVVKFAKRIGSSGWIRTSNPPVKRLTQVCYLVGSSMV
jgi:hypothetical protein